jgi:uncharacterized LabA/DUF88 family protein
MHFYDHERVALFIDGANLSRTCRSLGLDIDYKRMLRFFRGKARLVRANYYAVMPDDGEYSSLRPLLDWLAYNGFSVVTKPQREVVDAIGRRRVCRAADIELAVDAMLSAGTVDHIVLFTGEGDFRTLVQALQQQGIRVSVVSTMVTHPPMIADALRRQADQFVDLDDLQGQIGLRSEG